MHAQDLTPPYGVSHIQIESRKETLYLRASLLLTTQISLMWRHLPLALRLLLVLPQPLITDAGVQSAVLELNPDALNIASSLDSERKAGYIRSPLHGIPFLVKDNIATKDKLETTAGSWALLGSIVPRDAHVVAGLRQAGALLLGKATLSEWADMRSSNYSEGYSGRGGQARSPYNLTVNPGGSSSGSAGAVAGNLCMFALGTETDGSGTFVFMARISTRRH